MSKENEGKKWKKGGRKLEKNPKIYRYSVNFDELENVKYSDIITRIRFEKHKQVYRSGIIG